jgi:hypothetical protein
VGYAEFCLAVNDHDAAMRMLSQIRRWDYAFRGGWFPAFVEAAPRRHERARRALGNTFRRRERPPDEKEGAIASRGRLRTIKRFLVFIFLPCGDG